MPQPDSHKARATRLPVLTIAGCAGWGLLYASNHNGPLLFGDLAKTTPAAASAILLVAAGLAMSCRFLRRSRSTPAGHSRIDWAMPRNFFACDREQELLVAAEPARVAD
jgi:hypothetical protein